MRHLYESVLASDSTESRFASQTKWMDSVVWSKSDVKNFIFRNIYNHVNINRRSDKPLVVDDYIRLSHSCEHKRYQDEHNIHDDISFEYLIYTSHPSKFAYSLSHDCPKKDRPAIQTWDEHQSSSKLRFAVQLGGQSKKEYEKFLKDTGSTYASKIWPMYDGDWRVHYIAGSNGVCEYVPVKNTVFDGSVPSKDIR